MIAGPRSRFILFHDDYPLKFHVFCEDCPICTQLGLRIPSYEFGFESNIY